MRRTKRTYYLSYLEWLGHFNAGRCQSFEARTDAEAREKAATLLPSRATFARMKCVTERIVAL